MSEEIPYIASRPVVDDHPLVGEPRDNTAPFREELIGSGRTGNLAPADQVVTTRDATTGKIAEYTPDHSRYFSLDPLKGEAQFADKSGTKVFYSREQTRFTSANGVRHLANGEGVTEGFPHATIQRVSHPHVPHAGVKGPRDNKTTATVYSDGRVDLRNGDGNGTITAEAGSGEISWSQGEGQRERTIVIDGAGNYYVTDQNGERHQITKYNAEGYGAEFLANGDLQAGPYKFSHHRVELPDGSEMSINDGHVCATIKDGGGSGNNVVVDASGSGNVVRSGDGSASFMIADDVVYADSGGPLCHVNLNETSFDSDSVSLDREGATLHDSAHRIGFDGSIHALKKPLGSEPIAEAMETLRGLADLVRGNDVISPENFEALLGALAALKGATVGCIEKHNWAELHRVQNVSTFLGTVLGRTTVKGPEDLSGADPGVPLVQETLRPRLDVAELGTLVKDDRTRWRGDIPGQITGAVLNGTTPPDLTDQLAEAQGEGQKTERPRAQSYRLPDISLGQKAAGSQAEHQPRALISRREATDQIAGTS
jgi:hypothetical protein